MSHDGHKTAVFQRVDTITGGGGVNLGFVGVRARYVVGQGRCEVKIDFWFRLKVGFQTITISKTLGWMGCDEGLATALALAQRFDVNQIELCDPDDQVSEEAISRANRTLDEGRAEQ